MAAVANQRIAALQVHVLHDPGPISRAINWDQREEGVLVASVHIEKGFDPPTQTMRQVLVTFYDGPDARPTAIVYAETGQ